MSISHMLILVSALLTVGGAASGTLKKAGADRLHASFFLLCIYVLSSFSIEPADDISVSPACVIAAAWLFGNCFSTGKRYGASAAVLPASAALGAVTLPLAASGAEYACYIAGAAPLLLIPVFGMRRSLAVSAAAPIFAFSFGYLNKLLSAGYGCLYLGEACLAFQMSGMLLTIAFSAAADIDALFMARKPPRGGRKTFSNTLHK